MEYLPLLLLHCPPLPLMQFHFADHLCCCYHKQLVPVPCLSISQALVPCFTDCVLLCASSIEFCHQFLAQIRIVLPKFCKRSEPASVWVQSIHTHCLQCLCVLFLWSSWHVHQPILYVNSQQKQIWRNLMSNKPTYEITILFLCYNLPSSSMILMFHVFCCLVSNLKSNLNSNKNWGQIFMWWCCNIRIFVSNKTAFEILMLFGATHMCVDVLNWQFEKWCSKPNQAIPVCKQSLDCLFRKKLWFQGTYHKSQSTICIIHALLKNTHVHTH